MAKISKSSIKALVKRNFKVSITDDGAAEIAKILERKANEISRFAVKNAQKDGRGKVTKEDITKYLIKCFDGQ